MRRGRRKTYRGSVNRSSRKRRGKRIPRYGSSRGGIRI